MDKATCVIVLLVLAVIAACCVTCAAAGLIAYSGLGAAEWAGVEETIATEVRVAPPASLRVRNPVGDVTVRRGDLTDRVVVEATKNVRSVSRRAAERLMDDIEVQVEPGDSGVGVDVILPEASGTRFGRVDLMITVPEQVSVEVINEAGHVRIRGIEGHVRVRSETGTLRLEDVVLVDGCDVMNTTGDILFQGELPAPGSGGESSEVLLRTETGDIEFLVPGDSRFTLDAESETGAVNSKFELRGLESGRREGEPGRWLKGGVNEDPDGGDVILRTETGNIHIGPLP